MSNSSYTQLYEGADLSEAVIDNIVAWIAGIAGFVSLIVIAGVYVWIRRS